MQLLPNWGKANIAGVHYGAGIEDKGRRRRKAFSRDSNHARTREERSYIEHFTIYVNCSGVVK